MKTNEHAQTLADALIPEDTKGHTFHAVMLFFHRNDIGLSKEECKEDWILTRTVLFDNASAALNFYANTACPASQHLSAATKEELEEKIKQMILNFKNEQWLNNNLYPYL